MVSLKQVAALAGVSSSTVSRAVVAPERLHPKTLEKVREAIASLDYVPFAPARVLRSGRSRTIGIVAPTLMNELYARAVDTLEKEFLQFGYTGLLTCHRDMFYNPVTAKPFEWEFHRGRKVTEIPAKGGSLCRIWRPCSARVSPALASPR
jgi:DNA-binding LacI/PurR family transcriptional regulator